LEKCNGLGLGFDLDWVKSQDLSERVIVGPSDLSRLRNPLLFLLDSAQQETLQVQARITGYSIESVNMGIHVMG